MSAIANEIERLKNAIATKTGKLSELNTVDKSNLVAAINEVKANSGGSVDISELTDTVNTHITNLNNPHQTTTTKINDLEDLVLIFENNLI